MATEKDSRVAVPEPEDDVSRHRSGKKYLVTTTLYDNLSVLKRTGLSIPSREFVGDIEKELISMLKDNFAGEPVEVTEMPFSEMCDAVVARAGDAKKKHSDAVVVSTAPLIAYEAEGQCIRLNRIVDINGRLIGIGPRPGNPSIRKQIEKLIKGDSIIIIEDGSFTGNSLKFLLKAFFGRKVKTIVLGLLFSNAGESLRKEYDGEISCFLDPKTDLLDWMPSHDFFPFIPNSGRVVGFPLGKRYFPHHLYYGASLSMPYILPYGDPEKWASLKGGEKSALEFSKRCLDMTYELFREIAKLNHGSLVIGDLMGSHPSTSIPVSSGCLDFPEQSDQVLGVLHEGLDMLERIRGEVCPEKEVVLCKRK